MGSQGRLMASHICDGSKSARRIDGRIGVTNRERETRGPKRPVGSPAERLSLAILLVCFVASSLVCRCFVGVGRGWHGGGRPPPEATATCSSVNHIRRREVVPIRDSGRLEHADGKEAATHGLSGSLKEIATARSSVKGAGRGWSDCDVEAEPILAQVSLDAADDRICWGGITPPGMSRRGAEAQSRCDAAAARHGGESTIAGQSRGGVEGHSSSAGGAAAAHGHATRGSVAEGVEEALDEARPRAGSSRSRGGAAAGGGGESEVSRQSGCGGEGHAGSAAGSLASLEDATAGTAVAAASGTAPPDEPRPWTAASTRCWARSAAWMRRQPYRRAVPGWGSTALELGRWRSRSARTYDGDGRGRRTRRASTELLEGHSTQGWALASRWRSRPIHARDGGSTSTGLAMGLCCLPPPPPCAGESIRQFTLGATGIPPGYTLRLGIKSGSQWRRSPS